VTNALDAMPHGGTLTVTVTVAQQDDAIRIDCRHGTASEATRPDFEPFFTTKPAVRTGSASRESRIVQAHAGRSRSRASR